MDLFRTKTIGTDVHGETSLLRTLGAGDFVLPGIGALIYTGYTMRNSRRTEVSTS